MAEFLSDPSVLTKDKLKNELTANNVPLPSGEHKKEVYVQLYLKNLTVLNNKKSPPVDTFSSDEELPAPVVSNKSRSGRKATKKTDKPRTAEVEVTELTDEDLQQQLVKHGVEPGPIVASTRKVYEKKLQKLLDEPPAEPEAPNEITALAKADTNQNGNTNSDQYSDKEDEEIAAPEPEPVPETEPEPEPEPEPQPEPEPDPVPVVEKSVRSRGKSAPVTVRTSSRRHTKIVEEVIVEETPKKATKSVVEDILANEINTPTSISASCRRPIRGAAGRPVKPSEYWLDESRIQRSIHTESRTYSETFSRPSAIASSSKTPARGSLLSLLLKLLLLIVVGGSVFYAYQNLDAEHVNAVKGLLEGVMVPLQSVANYLGIGSSSSSAAKTTSN